MQILWERVEREILALLEEPLECAPEVKLRLSILKAAVEIQSRIIRDRAIQGEPTQGEIRLPEGLLKALKEFQ